MKTNLFQFKTVFVLLFAGMCFFTACSTTEENSTIETKSAQKITNDNSVSLKTAAAATTIVTFYEHNNLDGTIKQEVAITSSRVSGNFSAKIASKVSSFGLSNHSKNLRISLYEHQGLKGNKVVIFCVKSAYHSVNLDNKSYLGSWLKTWNDRGWSYLIEEVN